MFLAFLESSHIFESRVRLRCMYACVALIVLSFFYIIYEIFKEKIIVNIRLIVTIITKLLSGEPNGISLFVWF